MKAYILFEYEDVLAVFSSLEKAKECCEKLPSIPYYRILSFDLDNPVDFYGKTEWTN